MSCQKCGGEHSTMACDYEPEMLKPPAQSLMPETKPLNAREELLQRAESRGQHRAEELERENARLREELCEICGDSRGSHHMGGHEHTFTTGIDVALASEREQWDRCKRELECQLTAAKARAERLDAALENLLSKWCGMCSKSDYEGSIRAAITSEFVDDLVSLKSTCGLDKAKEGV